MGGVGRWVRGNWPLMAFALYWAIHTYIWVIWGWKETGLFDAAWWFDAVGHALAGIVGALNGLYLYWGKLRRLGKLHLTRDIVWDVGIFGGVWEGLEFLWDLWLQPNYFPHLPKAQKGLADTIIDFFTNPIFALLTILVFFAVVAAMNRWVLSKADQEEALAREAMEIADEINLLDDELDEKVQHLGEVKRELVMQHVRERFKLRKERIEAFFRRQRTKRAYKKTPPF